MSPTREIQRRHLRSNPHPRPRAASWRRHWLRAHDATQAANRTGSGFPLPAARAGAVVGSRV